MSPLTKWFIVAGVILLVPANLYGLGDAYTNGQLELKQQCLDSWVETSYIELRKDVVDMDKVKYQSFWFIENCFDFQWSEQEYYDKVNELKMKSGDYYFDCQASIEANNDTVKCVYEVIDGVGEWRLEKK